MVLAARYASQDAHAYVPGGREFQEFHVETPNWRLIEILECHYSHPEGNSQRCYYVPATIEDRRLIPLDVRASALGVSGTHDGGSIRNKRKLVPSL